MPFRALPNYFRGYGDTKVIAVDSTKINHIELINHTNWKDLYESIPEDTDEFHYKLVIFARHGEGYHNAAIDRYGMDEWDNKWALLEGDEFGSWIDSKLTPVGKEQVRATGLNILAPMVRDIGIVPHRFFSSPMRRCLETFIESWNVCLTENRDVLHTDDKDIINVEVFENIRESLGRHPCDKRVNHSVTSQEYKASSLQVGKSVNWIYEPEYPEEDNLWTISREEIPEMDKRILNGLVQVFQNTSKNDKFISVTCHSGVINSVLRNIQHPRIDNLQTGNVVISVLEIDTKKLIDHQK